MRNKKKIEERGAEDYRQGHKHTDNPYDYLMYPEEHVAWLYGFMMEQILWEVEEPDFI